MFLFVVNLFNVFLYFVILHEDLEVQSVQLYLLLLYFQGFLLLRVQRRIFLLLDILSLLEGFLRLVLNIIWIFKAKDESYSIIVIQHLKILVKDDDSFLQVIDHLFPAGDFIEFLRYPVDILLCDLKSSLNEIRKN